ncbi:MAG: type II toxin-antitoxin system PemK/MazF family toxin [Candidatus Micrarchaeota archaeon]
MRRRDVILARVFFSDSPESKVRPAVVLSDEEYHTGDYVLISPITTAGDDYCLQINDEDINCPIEHGSGARYDMVFRLHMKYAVRAIGKVTVEFHSKLVENIISTLK